MRRYLRGACADIKNMRAQIYKRFTRRYLGGACADIHVDVEKSCCLLSIFVFIVTLIIRCYRSVCYLLQIYNLHYFSTVLQSSRIS